MEWFENLSIVASNDINEDILHSLNLLEVLLNISDTGVYSSCIELFKFPITHCPDLLILGLLQLNVKVNFLYYNFTKILIFFILD